MRYLLIVLLVTFIACSTATTERGIAIPQYTMGQKDPMAEDTSFKAGDVEVFKLVAGDTAYYARMYRNDGGTVRRYETILMRKGNYDRVVHNWLNDSTVAFQLIDSRDNRVYNFRLIGNGPSTTLLED